MSHPTTSKVSDSTAVGTPNNFIALRAKQAFTLWRESENVFKNMSSYSQDFSEIENALFQFDNMKIEIEKKNDQIKALECTNKTQSEQWAHNYQQWDLEKQKWQVELESVVERKKTAHDKEMLGNKKKLVEQQRKIESLNQDLKEKEATTEKLKENYNDCVKRIKSWENFTSNLEELNLTKLGENLKQLFSRCYNVAHKYFFRDLPGRCFEDQMLWEDKLRVLSVPLSLPPSNSHASKYIRMVTCLHIVSKTLCVWFFKPCFIPESVAFSESMKELLSQQFSVGAEKERITRAILISTYPSESVKEAMQTAVERASAEIRRLLDPIGGANEEFRSEIEKIFHQAANLWRGTQHSSKMIEVSMLEGDFGTEWPLDKANLDPKITETTSTPTAAQFEMLALFPNIYIPEDDIYIFPGYALYSDHKIVVAAEEENKKCVTARRESRNAQSRPTTGGGRRLSVRHDKRSGAQAENPSSLVETKQPAPAPNSLSQGGKVGGSG